MPTNVVDRLHAEFQALITVLSAAAEPSLQSTANDCFRKALLLTAASHFEAKISQTVLLFISEASGSNERVTEFARQKGISRQYHTWFDWERTNANKFFALFGEAFKKEMDERVKGDDALDDSIKAFLEVGRERNRLVHQDFGNFTLEKTATEIFELYQQASAFAEALPGLLSNATKGGPAHPKPDT